MATLSGILAEQPAWSDLPVLVLTRPGADSVELSDALRMLGNVTVLECPLRVPTLLSAVRTAIRARDRQYQIRGHLAERARAEESLRQADQRKDEFLATLGHELRNPLAPVLTGLQLLKISGRDDATAGRAIAVMERQIRHLIRLVDDLLEVSRITTRRHRRAPRAARPRVRGPRRGRHQPAGDRDRPPRTDAGSPAAADRRLGRPGTSDAGVCQHPDERRQVHQPRRADSRQRRAESTATPCRRSRQRHRHPGGSSRRRSSTCSRRSIARTAACRAASASG